MFDFFNRLFGQKPSSATAKERLRLVLLSDHISLAPDVVEALKHDLIEVISRYVEVDVANCDVSFEQQDKAVAMLANIPILGMQKRTPPAASRPRAATPEPPPAPSLGPLGGTAAAVAPPEPALPYAPTPEDAQPAPPVQAASEETVVVAPAAPPPSKPAGNASGSTRRRRRKAAHAAQNPPPQGLPRAQPT